MAILGGLLSWWSSPFLENEMALNIFGQTISRVKVIDDDPTARQAMAFTITDADLEALPAEGPLPKLSTFVTSTKKQADAVVSDHRLKKGHYATFNGAEAVAELYNAHCPAVRCTRWSMADSIYPSIHSIYTVTYLYRRDQSRYDCDWFRTLHKRVQQCPCSKQESVANSGSS